MNREKNKLVVTVIAVVIIGGMVAAFGNQMFDHNSRTIEQFSNIDVPDNDESSGQWIKNTGSNECPFFVDQKFDANKSHYVCR